uniref:NADH-ubiquinone oxidoreductase chain 4 n=1 Tax=Scirpophaga incertulas TaxID=72366 RepID=R4J2P6_9NEOP|nr:NADH dehydrogenase subunit 4 [Scirpophaga incertulas]
MMKFLVMMIFLIPLCFFYNMFWMVQMVIFFMAFMYMCLNMNLGIYSNLSYMFSCDMLSYGLILLTFWICVLMIMASEGLYSSGFYTNFFLINLIFLMVMLFLTFSVMNLFMFYLFFEISLIPTLLMIIGWGYQPERIQAGLYLLFYTLFVSLPLLMGIFYLYDLMGFIMMYFMKFFFFDSYLLYFCMVMAFLVKMPMYFVHMWLPKAHVEAPVSGSMILAGIMLKMGGYGLMRVMVLIQGIGLKLNIIWISISLLGGFYISLKCFVKLILSLLLLTSSVAHMSMVIGGIMTMNYWGYLGSYVLMIGHGLCSSGMFCLAYLNYERLGSRSLFIYLGMMSFLPSMSLWWFLLISSYMASPPSLNLMGEMSLIYWLVSWSWVSMFMLMMISFLSIGYWLYLYSYTQNGLYYLGVYWFYSGVSREYLLLILHWLPLNVMVVKMDILMIMF